MNSTGSGLISTALLRERSPSSHAEHIMMNDYATIPVKSKPYPLQEEQWNSKIETGSIVS